MVTDPEDRRHAVPCPEIKRRYFLSSTSEVKICVSQASLSSRDD